ncbi:MarR family winged helix-turn-helix transcriptional regulator [Hydromonas duriensis]|uniref:DNA-binding MarR family transcriptional regulator n=1 Tax=Hydromonas duriensis TaxID=1527608 RepID=A0A4R6YAD7_9BURK|nr:MarR family transcriptional regulator [Hydromonas duriensis]TDR32529.1 DNA-binding MarR family transcriptional regulator [Hydromonas duriensis]
MNSKTEKKDCVFSAIPNEMKPVIALINRAAHGCTDLFNKHLARVNLTVKGFLILCAAYKNTSFSQLDIAKGLLIDRSTMVSLVDALEQRGLVERVRHVEDRRQYRVVLTLEGERLFKEAREIAYQTEDEYLAVLSDKQKSDLKASLLLVLNAQAEKESQLSQTAPLLLATQTTAE